MVDTIEWLETIGKDASLRHASAEQLANTLGQAGAPDSLRAAVMTGDKSLLSGGGGEGPVGVDHSPHAVWFEQD